MKSDFVRVFTGRNRLRHPPDHTLDTTSPEGLFEDVDTLARSVGMIVSYMGRVKPHTEALAGGKWLDMANTPY